MNEHNFRDELLGLQQTDPALQAEHDRRIHEMMEVRLKPLHRGVLLATTVLSVLLFFGFVTAVILSIGKLPWQVPAMFVLGSLFSAGWAVLATRTLRKGTMTRGRESSSTSALVWVFAVFQFILFFGLATQAPAKHAHQGTWMILFSLFFVIAGLGNLILTKIDQSSATTEEQILRLQLRMEQLASGQGKENEA